jgi:DNA-binding NarL/FixJ family response regulator
MRGHRVVVTTTPAEAMRALDEDEPDLCLMDLGFPDGSDGMAAVAALRERHPSCPVLVLSGSADADVPAAAIAAGAVGFVRKDQPISATLDALDEIAAGNVLVAPPSPRPAGAPHDRDHVRRRVAALTERELQVLQRLIEAEDTVGIARSLRVAPSTVRTHLQNVLLKLGVHNRLQAVAIAVEAGMDDER